ncbi:hypothetical protein ACFWIN_02860 [Streptomyces sp. NPDC127049]|uniref:hypothetical protein n=1 Tax=Streptomyces sp. NPDC127049 TaxID=3347118 RepID=UPI0036619237
MKPHARHIVVDGEELVVLPVHDFDNLLASRRQLGGQAARVRSLREGLNELIECLQTVEERLGSADPVPDHEDLAAELRRRVHRARKLTGMS